MQANPRLSVMKQGKLRGERCSTGRKMLVVFCHLNKGGKPVWEGGWVEGGFYLPPSKAFSRLKV